MTDEQKIEIIKKEPRTLPDDLTAEEQAFLETAWNTPDGRELYYKVWEDIPGNIWHAIKTAPCTAADLQTTAKTLRAIWEHWTASGASRGDLENIEAVTFFEAIYRRAQQCE